MSVVREAGLAPTRVAHNPSLTMVTQRATRRAWYLRSPESEVWLIWGDGSCGYSVAEYDTFARHGVPIIALVGNDAGWTQIEREQVRALRSGLRTGLRCC